MRRILLFTNIYPSERYPARGTWLLEQATSLRRNGIGLDVIHFNPEDTHLNYLLGFWNLMDRVRGRCFDIIHVHHTYTFYLAYLARALTHIDVPIVLTIHEQDVLRIPTVNYYASPLGVLRRSVRLRRFAVSRASFAIFVSKALLDAILPSGPAEIIPCGVNLDKFKPIERISCRRRLGIPSDDIVIFSPADSRNKRKRLDLTREAWQVLRTRVSGNVRLIVGGDIPHDQMPLYYNAADVALQTAKLEGSPTIVKEALACEVPIVSTNAGDTGELVEGLPGCWICDDDADRLAGCMQCAIGQKALGGRERLQRRGLSLDQVATRVISVYNRVLSADASNQGAELTRELS